jgi:phage tail-like protein
MAPTPSPPPPAARRAAAEPLLGCRFEVQFMGASGPNELDIRFRRVSVLSATVDTYALGEGGENGFTHQLPRRISRGNLVLERGFIVGSRLTTDVAQAMEQFRFKPGTVMVKLLGETGLPLMSWMFFKAYPVRWSIADLDAGDDQVLIDTVEVAYTIARTLRL